MHNVITLCCFATFLIVTARTLPKGSSIVTIPVEFPTRISEGYNQCLRGKGEHTPLLLSGETRCIQAVELVTSWQDGMTLCNMGGGHLMHVYNSREHKKIMNWILGIKLAKTGWTGQRKFAADDDEIVRLPRRRTAQIDSLRQFWMLSHNETIGVGQDFMYDPTLWDLYSRTDDHRYGTIWTCGHHRFPCSPHGGEVGAFHFTNSYWAPGSWAMCEYVTDKQANVSFIKHENMLRGRNGYIYTARWGVIL